MPSKIRKKGHHPDYVILALVFIITTFGLVMLASASSDLGEARFHDSYYYLKHQVINGLVPGLVLFLIAFFTYYRHYQKIALIGMLIALGLLSLVFTPLGIHANNAQRWVAIGPVSFQPGEFLKISFIVYLAAWLSNARAGRSKKLFEGFVPLMLVFGIVAVLLFLQPATSVVVVLLGAGVAVYFASGAPAKFIATIVLAGVLAVALLVVVGQRYRLQRILTYFSPQENSETSGYHLDKALTAVGSGGLTGIGFGESTVKQNLPARIDDSIFAVIASELGFIGAGSLVAVIGFLVFRIFYLAQKTRDRFGQLILVGFGMIIFLQSFINMAANSGLLPLTGLPLPFISYGGTALVVFLAMSGIILNISRYT